MDFGASRSRGDGRESRPPTQPVSESAVSKSWRSEPKFVPCEPYKGCVVPLMASMDGSKVRKACKQSRVPIHVPAPTYRQERESSSEVGSVASRERSLSDRMSSLEVGEVGLGLDEGHQKTVSSEVAELRRELKIQNEINADLKNLLVASIGEDWETRVQILSKDKAILGEYVKQYSDSLNRQSEENDNISIECDVWRSKFLASSLMVDELARCKAILSWRCTEARKALQALFEEHALFASEVRDLNRNLRFCQAYADGVAGDPSSGGDRDRAGTGGTQQGADILRLVSEANMRSCLVLRSLKERVRYNEARSRPNSPDLRTAQGNAGTGKEDGVAMTPAQTMAAKVLSDLQDMPYVVNENLRSANALYFPLDKALPFKCCTHCQGDIKVV